MTQEEQRSKAVQEEIDHLVELWKKGKEFLRADELLRLVYTDSKFRASDILDTDLIDILRFARLKSDSLTVTLMNRWIAKTRYLEPVIVTDQVADVLEEFWDVKLPNMREHGHE